MTHFLHSVYLNLNWKCRCATCSLECLSSIHSAGIAEYGAYICGQNILSLCRACGNQAKIFLYVILASYMKLMYYIAVYRVVLDRKGW
jgi:hypothetical protein